MSILGRIFLTFKFFYFQIDMVSSHQLEKSVMNIHSFNVSLSDRNNSLNLDVELVPVTEGRLFTIAVLIK